MIPRRIPLLALLLALAAAPAAAQSIRGTLREEQTGEPVAAGAITLISEKGDSLLTALSDSAGNFLVQAPRRGRYVLRATRIGYGTAVTDMFVLQNRVFSIDLLVPAEAVALKPLTATIRSRRRQQIVDAGGHWVDAEKVEAVRDRATDVGDILRWQALPGVSISETYLGSESVPLGLCIEAGRQSGTTFMRGKRVCEMVQVYVDDVRIAQPEVALKTLNPQNVATMALLKPVHAQTLYGRTNGVLLIYTRGYIP